jgi:streptomycin 6-kinase
VSKKIEDFNKLCTKLSKTPEDKIYDPDLVHKDILKYATKGYIADPKNLYNKRLYIYAGLRSDMFSPGKNILINSRDRL